MNGIIRSWGRILAGYTPSLSIEITRECPLRCPGCYAYGAEHLGGGVTLREVRFDGATQTLHVSIDTRNDGGARYTTRFIGTPAGTPNPDAVGITFAAVEGPNPSYRLTGKELYVRALVTSDKPPVNPSYKGQLRQAWTQPVGWEKHVTTP